MEAAVLVVVGKICEALGEEALKRVTSLFAKEVTLLAGVHESMTRIRSEFEVMKAFLSQAEAQKDKNNTLEVWLEQVRKVAFRAEDAIDEYSYIIGEQSITRFRASLVRRFHKSRNIRALHRIASQLAKIEADIQQLADRRGRWNINLTGGVNYTGERTLHRADSTYSCDDEEIVGMLKEKTRLVEWLTNKKSSCSIISVWGMGGLGKTTLVTNVYKSPIIQDHFTCHAWVSVSENFRKDDLLRRILIEFIGREQATHGVDAMSSGNLAETIRGVDAMSSGNLAETIRNFLQEKKYLLILDDVWSADAWFSVSGALPDRKHGCRIVITTRNRSVAMLATESPESHVLELQKLPHTEAWDLFCRKAFWKNEDKICPQALQPLAKVILEKCHGLPLAIVAIGSLLSLEEMNESEWRNFHERLAWELTGSTDTYQQVRQTLNLSYIYLPDYLKSCFLFCSTFPEDYRINGERLIRLWVAEGFVEEQGDNSAEIVAEWYLSELVHRCLLQVVQRDGIGKIASCRMHDLVRDLNVSISRTQKFGVLYDDRVAHPCNEARRMSVHKSSNDLQSVKGLSNLRSFIVFDTAMSPALLMSVISQFKLLRVLDLSFVPIERLPEEVADLFNLHYLSLKFTKVAELPKHIGRLRNLQTLDVAGSNIQKLPHGVTQLLNLRHLITYNLNDRSSKPFHAISGGRVTKGICNLKGLQTLLIIEANTDLIRQIGDLAQLRNLGITKVRYVHCTELCTSITRMGLLASLTIEACDEEETLVLDALYPPPNHLETLCLKGKLNEGVMQSRSLRTLGINLTYLYLGWSGMTEDPLPSLSLMSNLVTLYLDRAYEGNELSFRPGWFPKLKKLSLWYMENLIRLDIQEGSMVNLVELYFRSLNAMMVPRSITFLPSLRHLHLINMPRRFVTKLREENQSLIQHIPKITDLFERDGKLFQEDISNAAEDLSEHVEMPLEPNDHSERRSSQ